MVRTTSVPTCKYGLQNVGSAWKTSCLVNRNRTHNIERDNRTVRDERLALYIFKTIDEAQDHATRRLSTYNNIRPNLAIGAINAFKSAGKPLDNILIAGVDGTSQAREVMAEGALASTLLQNAKA